MKQEIVKELLNKGYLIEPELVNIFNNKALDLEKEFVEIILKLKPPKLISKNFFLLNIIKVISLLNKDNELSKETKEKAVDYFSSFIEKKETQDKEKKGEEKGKEEEQKKVRKGVVIVEAYEPKTKKITVEDFVKYFKSRFLLLKNYLQDRELEGLSSIGKISSQRRGISVIGLVYNKRITKNKNILLELEDITGRIPVIVHHDKSIVFEKAKSVVLDEVIAIKGVGSEEIIFANDIIFPDIAAKEKKKASYEHYAAFTADLHVGSDKFLEENFLKFLDWLNSKVGSAAQKELARKVRYLFIVGDIVDGVGVFPRQQDELAIKDVRQQYKKVAQLIGKIRKDIAIIICPGGQHDAVRLIEPQPKLSKEIASGLYELENVIITTNPSVVNIEQSKTFQGFNVLMYHGDSFDYYADSIDMLRLNNAKLRPDMLIHFLLKKRHLAPTYASTPLFPSEQDHLVIKNSPDIFVSGHIHKSAISTYNNILTISCSCWQTKTAYQEKFGHEPDPCKVPLLNLKTGKINVLDFS